MARLQFQNSAANVEIITSRRSFMNYFQPLTCNIGLPESTGILTSSESMSVSVLDVQQSLSGGLENKTIVLYDLGFDPVDRWVGERWRRIYAKAYEPQ
ncbi:hypothetical protein BTUL_0153g00120 [Botrytis tulipae]|uniref:Uncharacterized protein n=1 Tax=Botrytis tulipae TaxID=87230 RepID=A0A4Z1EC61_9HELO|nr:hypothetical protein BTUL_0153g00120 [Botrytis tulipae]